MGLLWTHTDTLRRQVFCVHSSGIVGPCSHSKFNIQSLKFFIILIIGKGVCEHECRNPWRPEEYVGSLGARVIWMLCVELGSSGKAAYAPNH